MYSKEEIKTLTWLIEICSEYRYDGWGLCKAISKISDEEIEKHINNLSRMAMSKNVLMYQNELYHTGNILKTWKRLGNVLEETKIDPVVKIDPENGIAVQVDDLVIYTNRDNTNYEVTEHLTLTFKVKGLDVKELKDHGDFEWMVQAGMLKEQNHFQKVITDLNDSFIYDINNMPDSLNKKLTKAYAYMAFIYCEDLLKPRILSGMLENIPFLHCVTTSKN